uniref:Uncharacterized protein n=1 Tax=Rhizophora mucronata TaxID=61149 RepID=A0A2P2NWI6_RHIMU
MTVNYPPLACLSSSLLYVVSLSHVYKCTQRLLSGQIEI